MIRYYTNQHKTRQKEQKNLAFLADDHPGVTLLYYNILGTFYTGLD